MMTFPKYYSLRYIVWIFSSSIFLASLVFSKDKITEINETTKNYWSHLPLNAPPVPKVKNPEWVKNPIDAFILSKLNKNGLKPNEQASKSELARRAYLNLTGLAPTPDQVSKFVTDNSPDAWEKLINNLLDSPQYGEKWARHWLDVVRYAESNGFERDSNKPHIWRYRDWVIDAYNNDKPYDRFIMEQLAGDELEDVDHDSIIATGFFRLMQWDDEPVDRLQARYDVLDDIVRVTTEGFLGMTLGCARCHDSKVDPIKQKDYYSFMAFFNGVTNNDKGRGVVVDLNQVGDPKKREEQQKNRQDRITDLSNRIAAIEKIANVRFAKRDAKISEDLKNQPTSPDENVLVANHRKREQQWYYTTEKPSDDWSAVGFRPKEAKWKTGIAPFGGSVPNENSKTPWKSSDIWLQTSFQLTLIPKALKMQIYHDEDTEIYLNGQEIASLKGFVAKYIDVHLDQKALSALQTGRNVISVHVNNKGGGQFFDMSFEAADPKRVSVNIADLILDRGSEIFKEDQINTYRQFVNDLKKLKTPQTKGPLQAMVVKEFGTNAEQMHVHYRGNANVKGDPVEPGFPPILGGTKPQIPAPKPGQKTTGRRTVLGNWITDPKNPRTSRVAVNRVWQNHFGKGICSTSSDFGYLGEEPTHPELLDWMATEFVEKGWSVKELQRMIMLSNTYKMSSRSQEEALAKDPQNKLIWRFNMRRMSAEEIRDNILSVTGQLNLKMGGESFYSKLDEAVLATSSTKGGKWGNSSPEERNRRAVYIKIKRSLKDPMLTGFDFADTDAPCPQRFTTTVATQALNLLNSNFVNDKAAIFAKRLEEEVKGDITARIKRGLEIVTSKPANPKSLKIAEEMVKKLKSDHGLDDQAALQRFCLVALNMNEFIFVD
ncbi:DUF1549 and DUF1553 domain-containing protein [Verrucomicrobiales bacterium]|nr:DUF1549 and DUF1553 domain-containing protein [Verrucomicrobiales bacterium]